MKFATTVLQPIALNARAHEHTRVLRHSIIFVHAYNKVIGTKYLIWKIEIFSKNIMFVCFKGGMSCTGFPLCQALKLSKTLLPGRFKLGCCP